MPAGGFDEAALTAALSLASGACPAHGIGL